MFSCKNICQKKIKKGIALDVKLNYNVLMNKTNHNLTKGKQMIDELKALEIANIILRYENGKNYEKICLITNDDGLTRYSDYGQNRFNEILDEVRDILSKAYQIHRKEARRS